METPEEAILIKNSVSKLLGREAIIRKIINRDQYFILDLAFSYFQKADRNRRNDYRTGYLYYKDKSGANHLIFGMAHSPIMTSFFKANFDYDIFKNILINTSKYRKDHYLKYKVEGKYNTIFTQDSDIFFEELGKLYSSGLNKTIFSKNTAGKTGVGNMFVVEIANNFKPKDIDAIIEDSWELFMWLYPSKPIFKRNASLNRSLDKIKKQCEINNIANLPKNIIKMLCSGQLEAAHILPYKLGGSDKLENGLWLCNTHHRITEGKLEGNRDLKNISVKYISNKKDNTETI